MFGCAAIKDGTITDILTAGEARAVFWDAIKSMTIADAFGILEGGDNAATDYFIGRTRQTLPLLEKPELMELDGYVTNEALDGLFAVLALEEGKIRSDPAARTTALLRKVFGR